MTTFDEIEESASDGEKIELYEFAFGSSTLRFTTADQTIVVPVVGGVDKVYTKATIVRTEIANASDHTQQAGLELEVPKDHPIADMFRIFVPSQPITITILQFHRQLFEIDGAWLGFVRSVSWAKNAAKIKCEPITAKMKREGLRPSYQRLCNWQLYGPDCRAIADSFKLSGTVTAILGDTVTSPAFLGEASGWLDSGSAVTTDLDRRLILTHVGDTITLLLPFEDLKVGDSIDVFAGCTRTKAICISKFNNLVNFGGHPWIPDKNPFDVGLDG